MEPFSQTSSGCDHAENGETIEHTLEAHLPKDQKCFTADHVMYALKLHQPIRLKALSFYSWQKSHKVSLSYSGVEADWTLVTRKDLRGNEIESGPYHHEFSSLDLALGMGSCQLRVAASGGGTSSLGTLVTGRQKNLPSDALSGGPLVIEMVQYQSAHTQGSDAFAGSFRFVHQCPINPSLNSFPTLLSYNLQLLRDGTNADVTFQLGDEHIDAHSLILVRVPYLKSLLESRFAEGIQFSSATKSTIIPICDMHTDTFHRVLRYIYSDDLSIAVACLDAKELMLLARAADMFDLRHLFMATCDKLGNLTKACLASSSPSWAVDLLQFGTQFQNSRITAAALRYIKTSFAQVALTQRFRKLCDTDPDLYAVIVEFVSTIASSASMPDPKRLAASIRGAKRHKASHTPSS